MDVLCSRFIEVEHSDEVPELVAEGVFQSPFFIIGGGSNLLLTADYPGTVLHSAIKGFETADDAGDVLLRCGSGEVWDDVVALCVRNGWYGAENLSLIPGEVGASAVQNIGAYGAEAKDIIETVEAEWRDRYVITHVTYRLKRQFTPQLDYGNIRSELQRKGILQPTAAQLRQCIIDIRNAKLPDPKVEGNAGSFFMNPVVAKEQYRELAALYPGMPHYTVDEDHEKIPAGWMIDQCGWKGRSLGRAGVHHNQALVLVNRGGASGADILRLCDAIRRDVKEKFGIDIYPEVNVR